MLLEATIIRKEAKLILSYRLWNASTKSVLAFTQIPYPVFTRQSGIDPLLAYCYLLDEVLVIERAVSPPPDGVEIDAAIIPLAELIAPGSESRGTVQIDVPLRELRPYHQENNLIASESFSRVAFRVGYLTLDDAASGYYRQAAVPHCFSVDAGFAETMQELAVQFFTREQIGV